MAPPSRDISVIGHTASQASGLSPDTHSRSDLLPEVTPTQGESAPRRVSSGSAGSRISSTSGFGEEEEEDAEMMHQMLRNEELIKELQHIIELQRDKILDLEERIDFDPTGSLRKLVMSHDVSDYTKVKEENEALRHTVQRQQVQMKELRREIETLRKSNRRHKDMLLQACGRAGDSTMDESDDAHGSARRRRRDRGGGSSDDGAGAPPPPPAPAAPPPPEAAGVLALIGGANSSGSEAPSPRPGNDAPPRGRLANLPIPMPLPPAAAMKIVAPPKAKLDSARWNIKRHGASSSIANLPPFSKLSRLISVLPMFWRDVDSTTAVLNALMEISGRLLSDAAPGASLTVYLVDPWLRSSVTQEGAGQPALFHLGQGKTTVQAYCREGTRPEPPQFHLPALPLRTRTTIAVSMQGPASHTRLAVLQAACADEKNERRSRIPTPRVLKQTGLADFRPTLEAREPAGFTDSQLLYLQIVCNVAAGILEQLKRVEQTQRLLDRMHACVDVTVAINKARSLPDFEQRVKTLLGTFFSVNTVRTLFYDAETESLLASSAQMRRKGVMHLSLDKGVVGLCAKRQALIHVPNISQHPYIDATADGLHRTGKAVAMDAAMLCGPLVVDSDDGGQMIGVVQLLERTKTEKTKTNAQTTTKRGANTGSTRSSESAGEFSAEDQGLFQHLLRVCAHAAWRTYKVHDLSVAIASGGQSMGLERLLSG